MASSPSSMSSWLTAQLSPLRTIIYVSVVISSSAFVQWALALALKTLGQLLLAAMKAALRFVLALKAGLLLFRLGHWTF